MNEPLRPLSLSEILDRTAQLYRSRFLVFLGISVVPTAATLAMACPIVLLFVLASSIGKTSGAQIAEVLAGLLAIGAVLVAFPVLLAVTALAMAAMSYAVSQACMGEATTIRGAYKAVWRRGWHYVWLLILEGLILGAAPLMVWTVVVFMTAFAGIALQKAGLGNTDMLVGLAVILVAAGVFSGVVWMLLRLSLAFPACVIEEVGAWTAIKRSNLLSNGTKGRIFMLFLLAAVLSWVISFGVMLTLAIAAALAGYALHLQQKQISVLVGIAVYTAAFAVPMLIRPVYGIALTLFYYDQRIRLEGYDIEWMMQQAGLLAPPPPAPEAAPWLPPIPLKPQGYDAEAGQSEAIQQSQETPIEASGGSA